MSDEPDRSTETQTDDKARSDRLRAAEADAIRATETTKARIRGGQDVSPADPLAPSHTPTGQPEADTSDTQGRERSLSETLPPFQAAVERLKRMQSPATDRESCQDRDDSYER